MNEDFAAIAAEQRDYFEALAGQIERGDPVSTFDRKLVAGAIRAFAKTIPDVPRRDEGQAPKFDHVEAVEQFFLLTMNPLKPMSKFKAREYLADRNGVSEEAIKAAIRKHGEAVASRLRAFGLDVPPLGGSNSGE